MNNNLVVTTDQVKSQVENISWTSPSWDLVLVLFFIVAAIIYAMSFGRRKVLIMLFSIYISLAIVNALPLVDRIFASFTNLYFLQVIIFLAIFTGLYLFLRKSSALHLMPAVNRAPMWQVIILSVLHTGLLIATTLSFLPSSLTENFSFFTKTFFVSEVAFFLWLLLPILTLGMIRVNNDEDEEEI